MERNARTLAKNKNVENWSWEKPSLWEEAPAVWQAFAQKWRNSTSADKLEIIDISDIHSVLDLPSVPPVILVRACYRPAIEAAFFSSSAARTGVIFTGQPGIGKTVLLVYLLVYLLERGQVVLFSPHASLSILFYHDGVYMAAPGYAHNFLPKPKPGSRAFIWSLFEAEVGESMAFAHRSGVLFPIQAPSPNPKHYSWRNYRRPPITALPLWDREELKQGLPLQVGYADMKAEVKLFLKSWKGPDYNSASNPGLLRRLRACCEYPPVSAEQAFDILVDETIAAFGRVAGDVYEALLNCDGYNQVLARHQTGFLSYAKLIEILESVGNGDISDQHLERIIAVNPVNAVGKPAEWKVTFKSREIAKTIVMQWACAHDLEGARELMGYASDFPDVGAAFAGWVCESIVHRQMQFNRGTANNRLLKPMKLDGSAFVLDPMAPPTTMTISRKPRKCVRFATETIAKEQLKLKDDEYYVPDSSTFPLIDSFLVSFHPEAEPSSADLWLFQMQRTSVQDAGSSHGYARIQNLFSILRKQVGVMIQARRRSSDERVAKKPRTDPDPVVRVHHVFVRPAGDSGGTTRRWTLPSGRNEDGTGTDHQEDGFLMEIHV
ncbi:hypothetical protein C8Q76DRAFT_797273 [Earliella scabrosa]|nr:hypothetical protein C8Q76DRAFT_797273 [Earliella scabrosa]